jgi:hypothetical protein
MLTKMENKQNILYKASGNYYLWMQETVWQYWLKSQHVLAEHYSLSL